MATTIIQKQNYKSLKTQMNSIFLSPLTIGLTYQSMTILEASSNHRPISRVIFSLQQLLLTY